MLFGPKLDKSSFILVPPVASSTFSPNHSQRGFGEGTGTCISLGMDLGIYVPTYNNVNGFSIDFSWDSDLSPHNSVESSHAYSSNLLSFW